MRMEKLISIRTFYPRSIKFLHALLNICTHFAPIVAMFRGELLGLV